MYKKGSISQQTRRNLFTRDFILGFLTVFFSAAAIHSLTPTLPIYLKRLGSNEREIGVLIGVFAVAALASRLFVGGALLKYREKSVMMFGALLCAITFLALIIFRPFWPFLTIRFFQGVTVSCIDTATLAFVVGVIPLAYRTRALGYLMLAPSLALSVAASLGIFVINQYGFTIFFLSGAGLSFCALFLSWGVKGQEVAALNKTTSTHLTSFLDLKIIAPAITVFLHYFVWGAVSAFFPLYAIQYGVTNPGHFFSAMAIMIVAGRVFGGKIMDSCNKEKFIVIFLPAATALLTILSLSRTLPMFIVVGSFWGIGTAFFVPVSMAYSLEYSGSSSGTAVGTFRGFQDLGYAVGPMVMGLILPLTGYRIMFLCLAFICLINLCYFQLYVKKKHHTAANSLEDAAISKAFHR